MACPVPPSLHSGPSAPSEYACAGDWKRWRGRLVASAQDGKVRQCTQCGYTWAMPRRAPRPGHLSEVIELAPFHLQSSAHLIGEQTVSGADADAELREALSHRPQCSSGKFAEYRADQVPRTSQERTRKTGAVSRCRHHAQMVAPLSRWE
jgi:hypothetical protein